MPDVPLYPLQFEPILKRAIWGGRKLGEKLHKSMGPEADYAESWELVDHEPDVSRIAAGPLAGVTLRQLMADRTAEVLGRAAPAGGRFPLLVKFIDARQTLSVQVHPNDELGRVLVSDSGKAEAWVVLDAEPGAVLYAGFDHPIQRAPDLEKALASSAVESMLHRVAVHPGDCLYIPAGTIHAIGGGILVAEIQQSSKSTFRVYDWGRAGADGRPRDVHLKEAMLAIDFGAGPVDPVIPRPEQVSGGTREHLVRCPYFDIRRLTLSGAAETGSRVSATILMGMVGASRIEYGGADYPLGVGETILLAAALGPVPIEPLGAEAVILECRIPT